MILLLKAKALPQGTVRTRSDGHKYKKVGVKWVKLADTKTEVRQLADAWRRGQEYFDYAMTTNLGEHVDDVLSARGIENYEQLVDTIKEGRRETAHEIYKELVDRVKADLAPPGDKKAVLDLFGRSLIALRDQYATKPKTRLTITKTSKKGNKYRTYEEGKHTSELPTMKPTAIVAEQKKMGGWSITGELTGKHVREMVRKGSAKVVKGKVDPKKKWILPTKAKDMELKYTGKDLVIRAKQVRKTAKSNVATAKVDIHIPFAFAKSFLLNQIKSARTRNNFIFRLERSKGYRDYLEKYGA